MAQLQLLPTEIMLEIIKFTKLMSSSRGKYGTVNGDLCRLRLVSKRLARLVCIVLFPILHLQVWEARLTPDYMKHQEIIVALASGTTTMFDYTQSLHFHPGSFSGDEEDASGDVLLAQQIVADNIFDAICALRNLRTVGYSSDCDPKQLINKVIPALGTLPSFQGFELLYFKHNFPSFLTLKPLFNLTIFRVLWYPPTPSYLLPEIASLLSQCPDLTELWVFNNSGQEDSTLREILSEIGNLKKPWKLRTLRLKGLYVALDDFQANVQHLKNLTFLGVTENSNPNAATAFGAICRLLRQHNDVKLDGVETDLPEDPLLLPYLSSYSGLTTLRLNQRSVIEDTALVDRVYTQVLSKHAETLECLEIGSFISDSLQTKEQLVQLLGCRKLTKLEVYSISNYERLARGDGSNFEAWYEIGLQLPNLSHLLIFPVSEVSRRPVPRTFLWDKVYGEVQARYCEKGMKFEVARIYH